MYWRLLASNCISVLTINVAASQIQGRERCFIRNAIQNVSHKERTQNGTRLVLYLWDDATPVVQHTEVMHLVLMFNPYPTAFPYGNGMVLHFYQQQESSTTKTVHKVINKGLKTYV